MRTKNRFRSVAFFPLALAAISACSAGSDPGDKTGDNDDGSTGGEPSIVLDGTTGGSDGGLDPLEKPPTAGCGNGVLTDDEACDDGNTSPDDGCHSNCLVLNPGFTCATPGEACRPFAKCGDGVVVSPEQCDDGATTTGDGCSATCKIEVGFKCDTNWPSSCTPTVCGDGNIEGAETCDDGPAQDPPVPFDGCSINCQAEPNCAAGACTSECGDGLVLGEGCDDGNTLDGDGCSSTCEIEEGYECSSSSDCDMVDGKCVLKIPVVYRDFPNTHADFDNPSCSALETGVVQTNLGPNGKPVLNGSGKACIESGTTFGQWYTDGAWAKTVVSELTLFDNGDDGYVNRFGENGEKFTAYTNYAWAANSVAACAASGCIPCSWNSAVGCTATKVEYDGSPFFFPVDGIAGANDNGGHQAKVGPAYGFDSWPWEKDIPGMTAKLHNFHFSTEVAYWFQYDATKSATLSFTGDDDVWVFINGKLAVDLGGLHVPESGDVTISSATAGTFGLEDGKVYEIKVFHAERKVEGSSFRLTLSGFSTSRSECVPNCGDGIIGFGEECDDGDNDGGYNECQPGCLLGGYCGDGVVQDGEQCDDNAEDAPAECSGCRILVVK